MFVSSALLPSSKRYKVKVFPHFLKVLNDCVMFIVRPCHSLADSQRGSPIRLPTLRQGLLPKSKLFIGGNKKKQ